MHPPQYRVIAAEQVHIRSFPGVRNQAAGNRQARIIFCPVGAVCSAQDAG
ncbi:Uncharacterised protein [Mycobacteroides abscessus subsp. abscessus]|nr:Uncharacterised protein [Mycobacteroides abscessus subsp. abscessus]